MWLADLLYTLTGLSMELFLSFVLIIDIIFDFHANEAFYLYNQSLLLCEVTHSLTDSWGWICKQLLMHAEQFVLLDSFGNPLSMMTSSNGNIFRVTGPLCGEFTGPGEFPTQRPVTRSFDVFFDLRLNKRLSKHSRGWWFETLSWSLWRHHNGPSDACINELCQHWLR